MITSALEWAMARKTPGITAAFVIAFAIGVSIESVWPFVVWLLTSLGAAFDNGWNEERSKKRSQ